jgi:hypothetical protein
MCWCSRTTPVKQIANEDITVYKTLVYGNSKYYNYHYTLGKLEVLSKDMEVIWDAPYFEIFEGFHSYRVSKAIQATDLHNRYRLYFNDNYSDWYLDVVDPFDSLELYECTIPKGSEFYSGKQHCVQGYASNKLIINEILDVKEVFNLFDWDNYPFKVGKKIHIDKAETIYQIKNIQPETQYKADLIVENCDTSICAVIRTMNEKGVWVVKY